MVGLIEYLPTMATVCILILIMSILIGKALGAISKRIVTINQNLDIIDEKIGKIACIDFIQKGLKTISHGVAAENIQEGDLLIHKPDAGSMPFVANKPKKKKSKKQSRKKAGRTEDPKLSKKTMHIAHLYESGIKRKTIAKRYKITLPAVLYHLKKAGVI